MELDATKAGRKQAGQSVAIKEDTGDTAEPLRRSPDGKEDRVFRSNEGG